MLELIAQGSSHDCRWRRQLPDQVIEIGRFTDSYRVPWDSQISRRHVALSPEGDGVRVNKISAAANPVFFNGDESDSFWLKPGQHFVIGKTTFSLTADRAFVSLNVPNPISQRTFTHEFLQQIPYRDADRRIEVLNRIPEVISSASDIDELLIQMVNTLIAGIAASTTIGIVELPPSVPDRSRGQTDPVRVIHWDRRGLEGGDFQPSEKLIRQAVELDETTLHIWNQRQWAEADYTFDYENDWAFVCPIDGEATPGWGIYVTGSNLPSGSSLDTGSGEGELQDDVKFCELVGSTLKNLLLVKQLERQRSSLGAFFSPIVMEAISGRDPDEVLAPRRCNVSVLFCDLRGFTRKSEEMADNLLALLARVSDSLGIMTHRILEHGGVIGDFHGDSAMGFWGWPIDPASRSENASAAISAGLEIQRAVAEQFKANPSVENFQIGLGVASGEAVAGKIGTLDQVKVTAFGPVVNLASRLEGMSKWFGSCFLADRETVDEIDDLLINGARPLQRRLGRFIPLGLENTLDVFQIANAHSVDEQLLAGYAQALGAFESGDWSEALTVLDGLSAKDAAVRFLLAYMARFDNAAPAGFDGAIRMRTK